MPSNPEPAHQVIAWLLDCGHAITCACRHRIGKPAYCFMCQETCIVKKREVRILPKELEADLVWLPL